MAGPSRWADGEEDAEIEAQRKREKEEKKRQKAEKQRKLEEQARLAEERRKQQQETPAADQDRPAKRQKVASQGDEDGPRRLLRFAAPSWGPCRRVDNFERLNHIEEGSYGWVSRARETATGEVVALKKLKMDNQNDGFPVTALREIQTLNESRKHRHIVDLREVVVGDTLNDVFLVMDFLEHDLKTLQEDMAEPFLPSEVKTLMLQLTSAVGFLHDHWILHRDLKTSNILMNNRGEIKIADFGMARFVGDPPPPDLTQLVVTLWYRAPELLLGAKEYDSAIDMWSLGCIFGELLTKEPLLQGTNEVDELYKIFKLCGLPTPHSWPSFRRLPNTSSLRLPPNPDPHSTTSLLRAQFPFLTSAGVDLLSSLLALNPASRPAAAAVLAHPYFAENPRPKATEMFPTFPSKAGQERGRRRRASPRAPGRGDKAALGEAGEAGVVDFSGIFAGGAGREEGGKGFSLKLV
ncbi:protein kinase [Diplodia corticola]|uniref:cyclin-dependent kinase n=1 Tax=Diplodia corticola TaxID=236234 RepID=A0A1J9QYS2_9PEZI|nr:protein kinase [Diplodia corticola]OJD33146.1 protein kinase [Diplodia corticola]